MPEFANQGQEASGHVLWGKASELESCSIRLDPGLKIIHIYNVPADGLELSADARAATVTKVEENGYIGFVLQSEHLQRPDVNLRVHVAITLVSSGKKESNEQLRQVRLIRPEIVLVDVPSKTTVRYSDRTAGPTVDGRLVVENRGEATAYLVIIPSEPNGVGLVDFFDVSEKSTQLVEFLKERFSDLTRDYPSHAELLKYWTNYIEWVASKKIDDAVALIPRIQHSLRLAQRNDPLFVEDLASVFDDAFRVNFTADERFTGWIKGFDTMQDQRVVLLNPWMSFQLGAGEPVRPVVDVLAFDQLGTLQSRFSKLHFEIQADSEGLLPIFELVTVGQSRTIQ